jgi:hypothetical protein
MEGSSVYPNPVKKNRIQVNIGDDAQEAMVTLTNGEGKVLWERSVMTSETEVDVDNLKPGIYYVQIRKGNEKTTKRVVVE